MIFKCRRQLIIAVCSLFVGAACINASVAQTSASNYRAGDTNKTLRAAILEVQKVFNVDILFEESVVAGIVAPIEKGWSKFATAEDALTALLKDFPLIFKKIKHNTYIIVKRPGFP